MPFGTVRWVKPKVFLTHKGVKVYHVYEEDEIDNGARTFSYTLDVRGGDTEGDFDVRELKTWKEPTHPPFLCGKDDTPTNKKAWDKWHKDNVEIEAIKKAICEALESGELK